MSEQAHTGGSWVAERRSGTESFDVRTPDGLIAVVGNMGATSDHAPTAKRWRRETEANSRLIAAAPDLLALAGEAWGALNFILAFYEPGQRYLDTNAWTQAEASGRRVHAALREKLDTLSRTTSPTPASDNGEAGR